MVVGGAVLAYRVRRSGAGWAGLGWRLRSGTAVSRRTPEPERDQRESRGRQRRAGRPGTSQVAPAPGTRVGTRVGTRPARGRAGPGGMGGGTGVAAASSAGRGPRSPGGPAWLSASLCLETRPARPGPARPPWGPLPSSGAGAVAGQKLLRFRTDLCGRGGLNLC